MEPVQHPKPVNYDQLYPGRYLKAGELLDKEHQLTIASVDVEELMDLESKAQDATKPKATIAFKESKKRLVACKTNGICLKAMFGPSLAGWIGKRIFIHAEVWNGKDCIRIGGSPDIADEIEVEIKLPKRKAFKKLMKRAMKGKERPASAPRPQAPAPSPSPADLGKCAALVASLEQVDATPEAVDAWWQDNANAIDALASADFDALQAAAKKRAGT